MAVVENSGRPRRRRWAAIGAGALALLAAGPAAARELALSTGFEITTGTYGQPQSTTLAVETLTAKYRDAKWALWVSVPWLESTGPGNVVAGLGPIDPTAAASGAISTGIGDVVLGASREIARLPFTGTIFDLKGKIRFGSASAARGLGTGRNAYYLELDATQPITRDATLEAAFGRRFTTGTPDLPLRDVWYGSAGGTLRLRPQWTAGLFLDMRQPSLPDAGRQQEVTASLDYRPAPGWKLTVYGIRGFAAGSPAIGGGLVVTRVFSF
jgi:hypothetical protein